MSMFYTDTIARKSKKCILSPTAIFADLRPDQLKLFEPAAETVKLAKGITVFKRHDRENCLYIVRKGKVTVRFALKVNAGAIRPIILTANTNDFFGEAAFIDSLPRTATAITEVDSELIRIDRELFFDILRTNPGVSYVVMKSLNEVLTERIRQRDKQLQNALIIGWNAYKFDKY